MKLTRYFLLPITILISLMAVLHSCRKDFEYNPNISPLRFSNDTILLDTVMSQSNSQTYILNVYNQSNEDIEIPKISLEKKNASYYRLNVDGKPGYEFNNIPLRAKDSLNIFISLVAEKPSDTIYEDKILFQQKGLEKKVILLSFIGKADYFIPKKGENKIILTKNTTLKNNVYHVIYGNLEVSSGKELNIEKGTKLLFYNHGRITLSTNSKLNINGTLKLPVVLKGHRFSARYDSLPQQWEGIFSKKNSQLNINYAIIKGANKSLYLDHCHAKIYNTKIYNSASIGIYAENSLVTTNNLVINNAGISGIYLKNTGIYDFYFTSVANDWKSNTQEKIGNNLPMIIEQNGENYLSKTLHLNVYNSILYGRSQNGIEMKLLPSYKNVIKFDHCIIKNQNAKSLNIHQEFFKNIITENPLFKSTLFSNPNLGLKTKSPAIKKGDKKFNTIFPLNIKGENRNLPPNIGAY